MRLSRKQFVAAASLAAGAGIVGAEPAAAQGSSIHFHVVGPREFDRERFRKVLAIDKRNKQAFQSVTPLTVAGAASLYLHMQNSMNAFEFSYDMGPGSLATLGILTGPSIVYALNDDLWKKYGFGAAFNLAATNVYYKAASLKTSGSPDDAGNIYQDWSAEAVLHRGGAFMVCHNAMTAIAASLSEKAGTTPGAALDEFVRGTLPGFLIVPSGVAATQLALERGWQNYPVM
jgi:hypothetical protein